MSSKSLVTGIGLGIFLALAGCDKNPPVQKGRTVNATPVERPAPAENTAEYSNELSKDLSKPPVKKHHHGRLKSLPHSSVRP